MQLSLIGNDIVKEKKGELFVSSIIIAENVNYEHQSIIRLINNYKDSFRELRPIDLKSSGINGKNDYKTWYELDENQVTTLHSLKT